MSPSLLSFSLRTSRHQYRADERGDLWRGVPATSGASSPVAENANALPVRYRRYHGLPLKHRLLTYEIYASSAPICAPDHELAALGSDANGSYGGKPAIHMRPLTLNPRPPPANVPIDPRLYKPEWWMMKSAVYGPVNASDGVSDESDCKAERKRHD